MDPYSALIHQTRKLRALAEKRTAQAWLDSLARDQPASRAAIIRAGRRRTSRLRRLENLLLAACK